MKKLHLEVLRIIAIFFVIFNHTGVVGFQAYIHTNNKILFVVYLCMAIICKISVPIFFMISGALLIGRQESIKELYKKRISRIIMVIFLFSFIQYIYLNRDSIPSVNLLNFLKIIYQSPIIVPYWYLYSYLSFLILLPFLRKMVKNMDKNDFKYMFIIWCVFNFIFEILQNILGLSKNKYLAIFILANNVFYPFIGYFCEEYYGDLKRKKILIILFISSLVCIFASAIFTYYEIKITGDLRTQKWLGSFVAIPTIFIYLLVKILIEKIKISEKCGKKLCLLGSCTFGIYLLESNLRDIFLYRFINFTKGYIKTMPACIIGITCIIFMGTLIIMMLKKLPIIKNIL